MDKFDELLVKMAKKDETKVPKDIDDKIDNVLENLEMPRARKKKLSLKVIALVAVITILSATSIIANTEYSFFDGTLEGVFNSDEKLKENIQAMQLKVEKTDTNKGITYKIDSVSVDENYMYIIYNIESSKNLRELQNEYVRSDSILSKRLSTYEIIYINGEMSELNSNRSGYFVNDNLYVGFIRVSLIDRNTKENLKLKVILKQIGDLKGKWTISTTINKNDTRNESKIVDVNTEHNVQIVPERNCNFIINRVVMSPLGNQILITNKGWGIDTNFKLFDDENNELELIYESTSGNEHGETKNSFDFVNENKDIEYINFVPYRAAMVKEGDITEKIHDVSELPKKIKLSPNSEINMLEMNRKDDKLIVKYKIRGAGVIPNLHFLDESGEAVGGTLIEEVDKTSGVHTETYYVEDKNVDLTKIKLNYSDVDDELLWDQAIKIPIK